MRRPYKRQLSCSGSSLRRFSRKSTAASIKNIEGGSSRCGLNSQAQRAVVGQFETVPLPQRFSPYRFHVFITEGYFIGSPSPMKRLPRTLLTSIRSVVFVASLTLLALGLTDCATPRIETEQHVIGIPQPDRWRDFVARAGRGEIEEVSDDSEKGERTFHLVSDRVGTVRAAHALAATQSDVFEGKFRPEAKTSYATRKSENLTQVDTLMRTRPREADHRTTGRAGSRCCSDLMG
jgi:hypothetical protein